MQFDLTIRQKAVGGGQDTCWQVCRFDGGRNDMLLPDPHADNTPRKDCA
jgi:hypothetical protein